MGLADAIALAPMPKLRTRPALIGALLVIALAGCAPAVEPDAVGTVCSPESTEATTIAVTNDRADDTVEISRYTVDCRMELLATLTPGDSITLKTYVGHLWAATVDDVVVSEFTGTADPGTWSVG